MLLIFEFLSALGGATVILYALTNFVSAIWASRMNNQDVASHSIAQEAYAKFFSSKMEAYIKLANLRRDYLLAKREFINNPLTVDDNSISLIFTIKTTITENHIYVSKKLVDNLDAWEEMYIDRNTDTNKGIRFWSNEILFNEILSRTPSSEFQQLFDMHIEKWDSVLNTIDEDLINLRKRYDL